MFLLFNCKLMYYPKFVKTIIEDDEKRPDEEEMNKTLEEEKAS